MTIHRIQLNENERIDFPASIFGIHFLRVESFIYNMAGSLSREYAGGYWEMYKLSNGGFYMAPDENTPFRVECMNGYSGILSADAFSLVCCLYSYSNLSFSSDPEFAETCAEHYHMLRDFALDHSEVKGIMAAID